MRLTLHADYGLRTLVYLATHPNRVVPTTEIGRAYGISKNHLVRVAQSLRDGGFIELLAGRSGGLQLAKPATSIRVGDVVRTLEPDLRIVECFDAATNTCPISPVCGLARVIDAAVATFLEALDKVTIGDAVARSGPSLPSYFLPITALTRGRKTTEKPKKAPPGRQAVGAAAQRPGRKSEKAPPQKSASSKAKTRK